MANRKGIWFWVLPLLAIVLCALLLQMFLARKQVSFRELQVRDGVLDITEVDLSQEVYNLPNNWDFYPGQLYDSQDFRQGTVEEKAGGEVSSSDYAYGTYRLVIRAKPNTYYTMCGFSVDYATRVFANGSEIAAFGKVADRAEDFVPNGGYMTLPLYAGDDGIIEVIYQYSNYVHRDGGFIQPTYISTPQNMEAYKAGNDLVSLSVSGGLLLMMLYFLLSAAVRRKTDFLCLALCCLVMALRDQNFYSIHLLPPDYSWYVNYRVFILVVMMLPVSGLLLMKSMYAAATRSWPLYLYLSVVGVAVALVCVLPTQNVVLVSVSLYVASIPYLLYLLWGIVRYYWKRRKFDASDALTLGGLFMMLVALLYEALLTGSSAAVAHHGTAAFGTIGMVLLTALAISLRLVDREVAFAESRSRGEMLERMNRMNMDFLHKVAHELRTPLTVISGYAQLTGMQLAAHSVNDETPGNLKTIQQEAQRLADMVARLMEYSYGRSSELTFTRIQVRELLENVKAIAAPVCLKNRNAVFADCQECPDIHGNFEMLLQVFVNLIVNANRHTQDGRITITAFPAEDHRYVEFRLADTGSGIEPEKLPHIFEQGYSGDGSSGLGLVICREAVESHGGTIWVEQTGPEGTVFAFTVLKEGDS